MAWDIGGRDIFFGGRGVLTHHAMRSPIHHAIHTSVTTPSQVSRGLQSSWRHRHRLGREMEMVVRLPVACCAKARSRRAGHPHRSQGQMKSWNSPASSHSPWANEDLEAEAEAGAGRVLDTACSREASRLLASRIEGPTLPRREICRA